MTLDLAVAFDLLVLGVAAALAVRVLLKAPVRREIRSRPLLLGGALATSFLVLSVAVAQVARVPTLRHGLAMAMAAGIGIAFIRARPGHGTKRGLPPGSLGLTVSLDAIEDTDYYARASARHGHVFKMRQIHQRVVCITDIGLGTRLFDEQGDHLRQSDWAFNRLVPGGYLEYMDGELHHRTRGVLAPAFSRDVLDATRDVVTAAARRALLEMSGASLPHGVHPEPFLLSIPQTSLIRMVLGISPGHPDFESIRDDFLILNRSLELFLPIPSPSRDAYARLATRMGELARAGAIDARSVAGELTLADAEGLDDPTIVGNLVLMVKEGGIMVRGMLRWVIKMLADHPREVEALRALDGASREFDERCAAFVIETIRLHESPYLYRRVEREVEVGGYRVPPGWLIRLCLREAHRDAATFDRPEQFEPRRHVATPPEPGDFCPFGSSPRVCPGSDIAVEIGKAVVREAALGFDVESVSDGPAWRINRHWGLWRPSRDFRIRLRDIGRTASPPGTGGPGLAPDESPERSS